jgi:hypothetical protein
MTCRQCGLLLQGYSGPYCNDCVAHVGDPYYYLMPAKWTPPEVVIPTTQEIDYAFTLTMPPDYKTTDQLIEACEKILKHGLTSQYEHVKRGAYVVEFTENNVPHIHGCYTATAGRRIIQKYWKRYWNIWDEKVKLGHGHKGGYHQKARHTERYEIYMAKEGVVKFVA